MLSFFLIIQTLGLAVILALIIILYKRIPSKNQSLILLFTFFVGINAFGYFLELASDNMGAALNGVKIAYVGKVYMLYIMILITSQLSRIRIPHVIKAIMLAIATVTLGMVVSCERHTWYYSSIDYTYDGLFPHLVLGHGPFYYGYTIYLLLCLASGVGICVYGYHHTQDKNRRTQIFYFLASALMQMIGFGIFLTGITKGYDTTALFNILSALFLLRVTTKYNLVDTLSVAKDQVLDEIGTGVVIVDENDHLMYANRIAKLIYPELEEETADEAVADVVHHAGADKYKFYENKVYLINGQDIDNTTVTHGRVYVLNDVTVSYYYAQSLVEEVDEKTTEVRRMQSELEQFYFQVINALSSAVEAKDRYTRGHSGRVAEYAREIARRMGMNEVQQREAYYAGLLHDIGKIRVPDSIINKDGKLTEEEYESMKLHTVTGYYILKNVSGEFDVSGAARWHHERYDGTGYPDGLEGENIPVLARIVGVADSYDAMTSNRSYRSALSQDTVRREIINGTGSQFDPKIADIMLQMMDEDIDYEMRQYVSEHKNIMLVDDDEANIEDIQEIFRHQPMYTLYIAKTIKEGKNIILEHEIDVVLVDMEAQFVDGFKMMRAIHEYSNIPIIFLTMRRDREIFQKAAELGVRDYLIKPFLPQTLLEIIHNVLYQALSY